MICRFIAQNRDVFGVVPICTALAGHGIQIAPRTFFAFVKRPPSKRELWDITIGELIGSYHQIQPGTGRKKPESMYGVVKMWAQLRRDGIPVARCTVARVMRAHGWKGVTRTKKVRTTVSDPAAARPADLVHRQFRVPAPNRLFVADFTYVPLPGDRFVYTALVIDAFSGLIPGWECSATKHQEMVQSAIRQAARCRARQGRPLAGETVHHSDAGSQYTAIRFGETLKLEGLLPSIGSVGDAYDNALAETTIGLYKAECVRPFSPFNDGPFETISQVERATSEWVHWYNTTRIMHRLGRISPAEAEQRYYSDNSTHQPVGSK